MQLTLRLPDGTKHRLQMLQGWRLMEIIRDWGVPIKAECGGACSCASCHIRVCETWLDRLPAASEEELGMLDEVFDVDHRSRLSCQILASPDLDGLEIELAADSLAEGHASASMEKTPCSQL